MERKFLEFDFETKAAEDTDEGVIVGMGAVFGNVDQGGDVILPGAFSESLAEGKTIPILWQHDPLNPIGVWTEIKETDKGLSMTGKILADVQRGKEAIALIKSGAVRGLSIGYRTEEASYNDAGNRLLHKINIWECSVCTFPMNPVAQIDSIKAANMTVREMEMFLRDAGLSKSVANSLISGKFKTLNDQAQRDAEAETKANEDAAVYLKSILDALNRK